MKVIVKNKMLNKQKKGLGKMKLIDNIQLSTLALPTVIMLIIFNYMPMFGVILAFKDYKVTKGILGSPWVGFKNFEFFFSSQDAFRITRNTILLNGMFILVGVIAAVLFALLMYEMTKPIYVKIYQTISILPSFLSWVAVGIILYVFLDPTKGIVNSILQMFNIEGISWYSESKYWPIILLIVKIWHAVGLNSIIYYAALMGVDNELFEAAKVDGANKFQITRYISVPTITPIIVVMTILEIGKIFRADFGLFYNVTKNVGALYPTTDVIDTYIFRALTSDGNVGMSAAVGLFQSVVGFIMIMLTNGIVKRIEPDNSLF